MNVEWRSLLAASYKGRRASLERLLSHAVEVDEHGYVLRVLCGRVPVDHVADAYAGTQGTERCNKCNACVHGTLHEVLAAAGFSAKEKGTKLYTRRIVRVSDGVCVGEMTAGEAWTWLHNSRIDKK